jgi:hypothetical protein
MYKPEKPKFYSDGITKVTDPFWNYICEEGHSGWSLIKMDYCPECQSKAVTFTNPNIKISPSS